MDLSLKVAPANVAEFRIDPLRKNPVQKNCGTQIAHSHPLKQSELKYDENKLNLNLQMLRNREGLAAPLKISMELASAAKVGQHSFLPSSNLQRDVLLGRDEFMDFSDFLGAREFTEEFAQPHAIMEKKF